MYTTIEAELENGRVISSESWTLPPQAHVFITLLKHSPEEKRCDFSDLSGRLKWSGDAVQEQRKLRDEW